MVKTLWHVVSEPQVRNKKAYLIHREVGNKVAATVAMMGSSLTMLKPLSNAEHRCILEKL